MALSALTAIPCWAQPQASSSGMLELDMRRLQKLDTGVDQWQQVTNHAQWDPTRTAVVICDMWNQHWCRDATARVDEMAPRMNQVITELRRRGVLIIHCPSDTMAYYEGTPGRKLAQAAPHVATAVPLRNNCGFDSSREAALPIDDSDGGCSDDPQTPPQTVGPWPWSHENDSIKIEDGDAITDNTEAFYLMRQRGITNVVVMGVHENMCIVNRPFGIRQMVYQGQNVVLMRDMTDTMYDPRQKPYVDHFTGTDLMTWHIEKYWCPTITSDQIIGGSPFRFVADTRAPLAFHNFVKLPVTDEQYINTMSYIEDTPNPDYSQAPEASRAAFREMKFGVRIHWGVYSMLGYGENASWPFVRADNGHPALNNEQREQYQNFYQTFNPTNFDADAWMDLFQTNGVKIVAFTTKHHDGFSMFDTHTHVLRRVNWTNSPEPKIEDCDFTYSIMDGPFHRDIVKEVTDAAHRHGVKLDLYFSLADWYDADFRPYGEHPLHDRVNRTEHPDQWNHFVMRARDQLTELLTQYGKIDTVCLDFYFDQAAWPDLRQTIKIVRRLQPDVMFRCRGIGNYGDYYTPEGFVPGAAANTDMPWMTIYPLAKGDGVWTYEPDGSKYNDGNWIVTNLVDTVAKGGNFMVGIGPDATGLFHPKAIAALQYTGAWLRTNGEAIFNTHAMPGDGWKDGDNLRLTRSDLGPITYAIAYQWPGNEMTLHNVKLSPGAAVRILGTSESLPWRQDGNGTVITLPAQWQSAADRPFEQPCVFRLDMP
jgi:alpha-L-fucosidase